MMRKFRYAPVLVSMLLPTLLMAACGEDRKNEQSACEEVCSLASECGVTELECLRDCREWEYPSGYLNCVASIGCEITEDEKMECLRSIEKEPTCSRACEKVVECHENGDIDRYESGLHEVEDEDLCAAICTWMYPEGMRQCLADMDEVCSSQFSCMFED